MARDMTLFIDDDGRAYHIYASEANATLHISQLTDDFLKPAGKYVRVFPLAFQRSPCHFKRNGKYYLILLRLHRLGAQRRAPRQRRQTSSARGPSMGNPCVGTGRADRHHIPFAIHLRAAGAGQKDAFIFMADRWNPDNAIDGRYIWLPIQFKPDGLPFLEWKDRWDLGVFSSK